MFTGILVEMVAKHRDSGLYKITYILGHQNHAFIRRLGALYILDSTSEHYLTVLIEKVYR